MKKIVLDTNAYTSYLAGDNDVLSALAAAGRSCSGKDSVRSIRSRTKFVDVQDIHTLDGTILTSASAAFPSIIFLKNLKSFGR